MLFFTFLLFVGCSNTAEEIRDYSRLGSEPMLEADEIDLRITELGDIVVRVQAPVMRSFDSDEKKYDEFEQGIRVQS